MDIDSLRPYQPDRYVKEGDCVDHIRLQYGLDHDYTTELPGGLRSFAREILDWVRGSDVVRIETLGPRDVFTQAIDSLNPILQREKPNSTGWAIASSVFTTREIQGIVEQKAGSGTDDGELELLACPYLVLDPECDGINDSIQKNGGVLKEGHFIKVIYGVLLRDTDTSDISK